MSHRVVQIQEWQTKALAKCEDALDEAKLTLPIKEALEEHHITLLPILANLHILCDVKATKSINRFFAPTDERTKGEATAEINAWRDIQRLIENLIPKKLEAYFHDNRRTSISRSR